MARRTYEEEKKAAAAIERAKETDEVREIGHRVYFAVLFVC